MNSSQSMTIRFTESRQLRPALCGLAAVIFLLAAGCARVENGGSSPEPSAQGQAADKGDALTIVESTQGTYGGLRIGVGYVHKGEYLDPSGAKKEGRVAGLWLFYRTDPAKNQKIEVHEGQRVSVAEYAFVVEEIKSGMKGSVRLRFETTH